MATALNLKVGASALAVILVAWGATELAARKKAMGLAKEYGYVRDSAINAPEVRIMTEEGASELIPHLHNVPDLYKVGIFAVPLKSDQMKELSQLDDLEVLHLAGCDLSDDDVALLIGMPKLRFLDVSSNPLSDDALKSIAKLSGLEELDISRTDVDGHLLGELQNISRLRKIRLAGTKIDDSTLEELAKVRSLEDISLTHTEISAEGLMKLAPLHRLRLLAIPGERIYGKATHDNMAEHEEAVLAFWSEFNATKRKAYQEAVANGDDVPDQFVSPFSEKYSKSGEDSEGSKVPE